MKKVSLLIIVTVILMLVSSSVLAAPQVRLGDLNEDGDIDSTDYTLMRRDLLGMDVDFLREAGLLNEDDNLNSLDYTLLRRYLLGMIDSFPGESEEEDGGFYVEDGTVYDAVGNEFVMRGINYPHTWFKDKLDTSLDGIAATGANTIRVVLSNGGQWTKDSKSNLEEVIEKCKEHDLVAVLEVHDCTGYGSQYAEDAVHLSTAVDYWIEMKDVLQGEEEHVIIDIANEPFGNDTPADTYVNDYIDAITRLREEGFAHALMVDGAQWGQDWKGTMKNRASEIFNADPDENVIFAVHMYEVYQNDSTVNNYMQAFVDNGLPLIVGEFGADHKGQEVAEGAIMERAEQYDIGYIGWSWTGNNEETASLDIVEDWPGDNLTSWGEILVNGPNGLKETAEPCSIFN
jgi:mannan endo-1,4-beta-mannosidase